MTDRYVLIDGEVKPEPDLKKWAEWIETADRTVKVTKGDKWVVSTVFMGLDYSFGEPQPIVFETMVFKRAAWDGRGALREHEMNRYSTLEEAKAGHADIVKKWIGGAQIKPDAKH